MDAGEHLLIGLIVGIVVGVILYFFSSYPIEINNIIVLYIIMSIYCLLPDIDHPISKITWFFIGISILGLLVGIGGKNFSWHIPYLNEIFIISIILLVSTFVLAQFAGHRGFVHTIWFGAIVSAGLFFVTNQWQHCVIAFCCFYSHLAADGLWFKF